MVFEINTQREGEMDDSLRSDDPTKSQQEAVPAQSEQSSVSTAGACSQPASTGASAREKDGSVISAVTDPASVEGPLLPAMEEEEEASILPGVDPDVPEHVILDEPVALDDSPNPNPSDISVVGLPEKLPAVPAAPESSNDSREQKVVKEAQGPSGTPTKRTEDSLTSQDDVDFSPSPAHPSKSEIVERSPGGRYVRFLEKLGSGASKDVYKAYDTEEGIEVAWNIVSLSGVPKTERSRLVNEVRLLERLHHQNIISFHGSWINREKQEVIFVTEILSSGTLKSFINKVQVIRWKIAKRWAMQILKGLEYLHAQDPLVIHRDLKCENIFINGTSGDLRIGDLGLSTVHQNGKMLSVLGTPEFMAPDMYEDKPYDEKVDVYAFGMCLLEIFTKEIPYSECNNPAQIYKKVSNGELPEVLSRLQSKHAREFVILCLGYRDAEGNYIRPSVSELIKHPFLLKRENDDDEVVVEKPLRERAILEGESFGTPKVIRKVKHDSSKVKVPDSKYGISRIRSQAVGPSGGNKEDADKLEEMPESETNMRKVTVMIGRNEELKEDSGQGNSSDEQERANDKNAESVSNSGSTTIRADDLRGGASNSYKTSAPLSYLVFAEGVVENSNSLSNADGVLKLVITLPVDGENLNVQFDFHLVDDNPFRVAKEMVEELRIPEAATVEISETISLLAQNARIQLRARQTATSGYVQHNPMLGSDQAQYHQQAGQGPAQNYGGSQSVASKQDSPTMQTGQQVHLNVASKDQAAQEQNQFYHQQGGQVQHPGLYHVPGTVPTTQSNSHGQVLNHSGQQQQQAQHYQHRAGQAPAFQMQGAQGNTLLSHTGQKPADEQSKGALNYSQPSGGSFQAPTIANEATLIPPAHHQEQVQQQGGVSGSTSSYGQPGQAASFVAGNRQLQTAPQTTGDQGSLQSVYSQPSNGGQYPASQMTNEPSQVAQNDLLQQQGIAHIHAGQVRTAKPTPHVPTPPQSYHQANVPHPVAPANPPLHDNRQTVDGKGSFPQPQQGQSAVFATQPQRQTQPSASSSSLPPPAPRQDLGVRRQSESNDTVMSATADLSPSITGNGDSSFTVSVPGASAESSVCDSEQGRIEGEDSDEDDAVKEELRKLEEDYQKNIQRAKKVFDNRMDNLQRSQFEKEAQHQKTLEKHQKERAEFEKRLAEEEKQQNMRIEKLQKELDKKRQKVALQKRALKNGVNGDAPDESIMFPVEPEVSHTRSLSSSSSNPSSSPAAATHKLPPESNAGGCPPAAER